MAPAKHGYYGSAHWDKLRLKVLRRDNWTCTTCGVKALGKKRNGIIPHVDHIKPRTHSTLPTDKDTQANCHTLCQACHNKKTSHVDRNTKHPTGPDGFPVGSEWGA